MTQSHNFINFQTKHPHYLTTTCTKYKVHSWGGLYLLSNFRKKKNSKRYPIFSIQIIYYQIDQMHKWNIIGLILFSQFQKMEFSYFLHVV